MKGFILILAIMVSITIFGFAGNWSSCKAADNKKSAGLMVTNSIGMKLTTIPAGNFEMGSAESAEEVARAFGQPVTRKETPRHTVMISKPFEMGVYEVTVGQFRKFVTETNYRTDVEKSGQGGIHQLKQNPLFAWQNPGFRQSENHPVTQVSWNDAMAFCNWLSAKKGETYRLPTEAEWEYACRAGTRTRYYNGKDPEGLIKVGNIRDASFTHACPEQCKGAINNDDGYAFTAPVGSYAPNGFGLYDMHGNVAEYCLDWYSDHAYTESSQTDPIVQESGRVRTLRGGSFAAGAFHARSASRGSIVPFAAVDCVGFRVVKVK